jgi:hypothetical protein
MLRWLSFGYSNDSKHHFLCFNVFVMLSQILTDPDHCYCVLLNARGGAALPPELFPKSETELRGEAHVTPSKVSASGCTHHRI